jgi:type II secretory ATPase GspE/PulE/Tfp pilus assembly ATPase PilB-like protein
MPAGQVTTDMIEQKAIEDGMLTMLQDGVLKVLRGDTTLEEVYRVVG